MGISGSAMKPSSSFIALPAGVTPPRTVERHRHGKTRVSPFPSKARTTHRGDVTFHSPVPLFGIVNQLAIDVFHLSVIAGLRHRGHARGLLPVALAWNWDSSAVDNQRSIPLTQMFLPQKRHRSAEQRVVEIECPLHMLGTSPVAGVGNRLAFLLVDEGQSSGVLNSISACW